jgi:Membrane protease subunits, stomatin/prohibitin homologs
MREAGLRSDGVGSRRALSTGRGTPVVDNLPESLPSRLANGTRNAIEARREAERRAREAAAARQRAAARAAAEAERRRLAAAAEAERRRLAAAAEAERRRLAAAQAAQRERAAAVTPPSSPSIDRFRCQWLEDQWTRRPDSLCDSGRTSAERARCRADMARFRETRQREMRSAGCCQEFRCR